MAPAATISSGSCFPSDLSLVALNVMNPKKGFGVQKRVYDGAGIRRLHEQHGAGRDDFFRKLFPLRSEPGSAERDESEERFRGAKTRLRRRWHPAPSRAAWRRPRRFLPEAVSPPI